MATGVYAGSIENRWIEKSIRRGIFVYENLYCKIFINTDMTYEALFAMILKELNGEKQWRTDIITNWCSVSVRENKEYCIHKMNDFLYWRYYLDVDPIQVEEGIYIQRISEWIKALKKVGNVVAACDFEDEL